MHEKILNIGYTTYLQKEKKQNKKWTSNIFKMISRHKILSMCLLIVFMCFTMNFMLIYNFIKILEQSSIL